MRQDPYTETPSCLCGCGGLLTERQKLFKTMSCRARYYGKLRAQNRPDLMRKMVIAGNASRRRYPPSARVVGLTGLL